MTPTKEALDQLSAEEAELTLDRFDEEDAWRLGCILVEEARNRKAPVAVDVQRPGRSAFTRPCPRRKTTPWWWPACGRWREGLERPVNHSAPGVVRMQGNVGTMLDGFPAPLAGNFGYAYT